ncbi:MAG: ABC transporter permease subunit [Pseudomonadota bacterium]
MLKYIVKRLLTAIPVIFIIASLTFFLMHLAPGGPFDSEKVLPPEIEKNINAKFHFDKPLYIQYLYYMKGLLQFDLGPSYKYQNRNVSEIILSSVPVSLELGLWAIAFALLMGTLAGIISSNKRNSFFDYIIMAFAMLGISTPSFVLGPLLILIFAIHIKCFPVAGWETISSMILPALTLSAIYTAYIARLARGGMLEILSQNYIKVARAKGLSEKHIMFKHALKGGILPVVSFTGPALAGILTGSMVVETIFNIPGLGRYFVQSALNRDYTLVMGTALFYASLLIIMNLIVDIIYAYLDPRVRYE